MASATISGRLRSEWKLKLILTVALNFWVQAPYYFLQHHQFFQPTAMPASSFDRLIPFSDQTVWVYLSIYLLMPIGPLLMNNRKQILRYTTGVVTIAGLADFVFFFWPTSCPRPVAGESNAAYRMLTTMDNPFHAFPSLHAAFAVYSGLCATLVLRDLRSHLLWKGGVWLWTFLILLATLTTKQHMAADILAGSALALGVYLCVFYQWIPDLPGKLPIRPAGTNTTHPNSTAL